MSDEKKAYWVGFDLGGTKMMAAIFDNKFKKVAFAKKKTKGNEGASAGLKRIINTIQEALDNAGLSRDQLAGIGAGCPGPLDLDAGIILTAPNLGWSNVKIKATLEKEFGCPTVIANDVDAGTYGEYRFGAAQGARCVLGVFPGTGIGGACVYEGKLLRGKKGSCMEIGHFPIDPQGPVHAPGQYGSLESIASRLAISGQAAQAVYRGQAPALKALAGDQLSAIKSSAIAQAIEAGDLIIEEIVKHAAQNLGRTIAGVVNLLAPDVLVLGGGLVEEMPKLYVKEIKQAVTRQALPAFVKDLKIVAATLGGDAGVMGAAGLAQAAGQP